MGSAKVKLEVFCLQKFNTTIMQGGSDDNDYLPASLQGRQGDIL